MILSESSLKTSSLHSKTGRENTSIQTGSFIEIDGESFVFVERLEELPTFFFSMVSSGDHWFFAATNGSLSAGRKSPDNALFPYYTVDKITANWNCTGPQTIIRYNDKIWEPFKPHSARLFPIAQRIYKSLNGDSVIFEESNAEFGLCYRYRWQASEKYGFVRTVTLINNNAAEAEITIVDGLADLLPSGIDARTQLSYSCLIDAYRLSELNPKNKLLVHRMAASLIDEAVPLECLLATTVWSVGWPESTTLLRLEDSHSYFENTDLREEVTMRGTRGAYFNAGKFSLPANACKKWSQIADINKTQGDVAELSRALKDPEALFHNVLEDIAEGKRKLDQLIAASDGQQVSQDRDMTTHHRANILFNIMRGGVFSNGYEICSQQFSHHIQNYYGNLTESEEEWLDTLPSVLSHQELIQKSNQSSARIKRICIEYLPLVFSRRHGDPSRPWNRFSIQTTDQDGQPIVGFQGNWRDIFQNWEALAWSFPKYNLSFIHKFLNASTADGYNPYRITNAGIEWEEPDENDPWASIGYWGDHQIIYLLKLLEFEKDLDVSALRKKLNQSEFVFADVPYEIKSFNELERDPKHSIYFNEKRNKLIAERAGKEGSDGKLAHSADGDLVQATLLEKLIIPAVVKLSNYVPGGGIWMNTQRPEWNDANNALAGYGLSMVTACYLHRYLHFLEQLIAEEKGCFTVNNPLGQLLGSIKTILNTDPGATAADDNSRYETVKQLGLAGETYRKCTYNSTYGEPVQITVADVRTLISDAIKHLKHTIALNRREDKLYHAYNILQLDPNAGSASVDYLDPMLEGQVAALSSKGISQEEALAILKALPQSPLYCSKRESYILYPDKTLPEFLDFNRIPNDEAVAIPLLAEMAESGDQRILVSSADGCMRFNAAIRNRFELDQALDGLADLKTGKEQIEADRPSIHKLYEKTFNHHAFTGRSGSMFSYEGLGCIYWHMVSKLMLAALEVTLESEEENAQQLLTEHYYTVQNGLGFRKTAAQYGAFPADAYSHTPSHAGAQQPGLTGMVKEGVICRFLELGIRINQGTLSFQPKLLRKAELTTEEKQVDLIESTGEAATFRVPSEAILFTLAQTPVLYRLSQADTPKTEIEFYNGKQKTIASDTLDQELSASIIDRRAEIKCVIVHQPAGRFI